MTSFIGNTGCCPVELANSDPMRVDYSLDVLSGGINNVIFDTQRINPSRAAMERVCRFFSLGDMRDYGQLKDIIISPTNPIILLKTANGRFIIKFYPASGANKIRLEYALNQTLLEHHFPTPAMHAGQDGKPFLSINGRLAVCFSYFDGPKIFQCIHKRDTIRRVNAALLSLNNILLMVDYRVIFEKEVRIVRMINHILTSNDLESVPSTLRPEIRKYLFEILKMYQSHRSLFTRQYLHTHANLSNFIIHKQKVYVLDLEHIQESYSLSDLASLAMHSIFFGCRTATIKNMVRDYFSQNQTDPNKLLVFNVLLKFKLIKEYTIYQRQWQSVRTLRFSPQLARSYRAHLKSRKECIMNILRKETIFSL